MATFAPEIIKEQDGFKAGVVENTWLHMDVGWGNGYVMLPNGHPWITDHPFRIDCDVNGGITFGKEIEGEYWIGFDTCHAWDNSTNWPRGCVETETLSLLDQALAAYKPVKT